MGLSIGIIFIIIFLGLGLANLYPTKDRGERIWTAPWWGLCLIVLLGGTLSLANIPMKYGSYVILGSAVLLNLYVLLQRKLVKMRWTKTSWYLLLIVAALVIFYLYPLWHQVGYPTTLSLGNLDPVTYANGGEFLREQTVIRGSAIDIQRPYTWSIVDILHYGFRWGAPLLLAFLASTLRQDVYQIYTITLAIFTALTVPLVYYLGKRLLDEHATWLLAGAALFFGLNSTLMYWQFHAFLPQFLYGGTLLLTILVAMAEKPSKAWWMGVCLATITSVYPDGIVIALVPLLLAWTPGIWRAMLYAAMLSPVTVANCWAQIVRLVKVTTNTTFIGWERIRWGTPWEIMGLHNLNYSRDLAWFVDVIPSLPILAVMIWGLTKITHRRLMAAYILVILGFLGFYRVIVVNFFVYQRVIGYGMFLWAVFLSVGLSQIKNKTIYYGVMIILATLSLRSSMRTMTQYANHTRVVDQEIAELQLIPTPKTAIYTTDVLVEGYDLWTRVWEEHFLRAHPTYTRANFPQTGRGNGPWTLLTNKKSTQPVGTITWENSRYQLLTSDQLPVAKDLP